MSAVMRADASAALSAKLGVSCPVCGATPWIPCRTMTATGRVTAPHRARIRLAKISAIAPRPIAADRFWSKVDKTSTCWNWKASLRNGYGRYWTGERMVYTHRYVYELLAGPIPDGLVLDHLCRNTICCNPDHLEPVTGRENTRRGACARILNTGFCSKGHEMTPENTYVRKQGWFNCRACCRIARQEYRARRSAA